MDWFYEVALQIYDEEGCVDDGMIVDECNDRVLQAAASWAGCFGISDGCGFGGRMAGDDLVFFELEREGGLRGDVEGREGSASEEEEEEEGEEEDDGSFSEESGGLPADEATIARHFSVLR